MDWGPIVIVAVLVIALPVATLLGGLVGAAGLGWLLKDDADARFEGSELVDLNR